jgi:hypothetical protein
MWSLLNRDFILGICLEKLRETLQTAIKYSLKQARFEGLEYPGFKFQQKFLSSTRISRPTFRPSHPVSYAMCAGVYISGDKAAGA